MDSYSYFNEQASRKCQILYKWNLSSTFTTTKFLTRIIRDSNYIGNVIENSYTSGFEGQIKSFNIWERALSGQEIQAIYAAGRDFDLAKPHRFAFQT